MSLPELSIRRPVLAWMIMAAVILFGALSFTRLGLSLLPDVDQPAVMVDLNLPGASPQVMESQVLDLLEDAIMELDGVTFLDSEAVQGSGWVYVRFEYGRDIDHQVQLVNNKVRQMSYALPMNLRPPQVRKRNPEDQPILWLALGDENPAGHTMDLMLYARDVLYNQFAIIPGVANVALGGYVGGALRVWVDQDKLDHFDLTSEDLLTAVAAGHGELPAGRLESRTNEANVRVFGEARTPAEFAQIQLASRARQGPTLRPVTIADVGRVEEGVKDVRNLARFNGRKVVGLGIIKQHGANSVEVAEAARRRAEELARYLPPGYHLEVRTDDSRFVKQAVDGLLSSLALSAALTAVVCFLFLGSVGATVNVLLAIPTSVIGTFTLLYFLHFTLNTFTLLGLGLAIGIVVDDAIMVLENIVRYRELGYGKREAARRGAAEITFAATAASIAVIAIFLPVAFVDGVVGRYLRQFGLTVSAAVALSLLAALTVTPMCCARNLNVGGRGRLLVALGRLFAGLATRYRGWLVRALHHRAWVLGLTAAGFAGSLLLARALPTEMVPPQDQSMLQVRYKLPRGTALAVTDRRSREVEEFLRRQPEVIGVFNTVGGWGGDAVNEGQIQVTLVSIGQRKLSQRDLMEKWRAELHDAIHLVDGLDGDIETVAEESLGRKDTSFAFAKGRPPADFFDTRPFGASPIGRRRRPGDDAQGSYNGMRVTLQDMSMKIVSFYKGSPVEFVVKGPDAQRLAQVTEEVMAALRRTDYLTDVDSALEPGIPELDLTPKRKLFADHGISLNRVTDVMNALVVGHLFEKESSYAKGTHRLPVELRLLPGQRGHADDLDRLTVRNSVGEAVHLGTLFERRASPSPTWISRVGRQRAIEVDANVKPDFSQEEALNRVEAIARPLLPPDYSIEMTGGSQALRETFRSLSLAILLGVMVSYMVLATQFNSFLHPVAVLAALPFSLSGGLAALLLTHQSLNIYSFIGFILLLGIAKKNSILLVDFTNQLRRERGRGVHEALLEACPTRLRPILMTSFATVAAALPEAFHLGAGSETTVPMAVAVIGGVSVSTFLTLFVVPCAYLVLSRFEVGDTLEAERERGQEQEQERNQDQERDQGRGRSEDGLPGLVWEPGFGIALARGEIGDFVTARVTDGWAEDSPRHREAAGSEDVALATVDALAGPGDEPKKGAPPQEI